MSNEGCRFRTLPVGTVGIYHTGQQSGTLDPPVSYRKKILAVPDNFEQYRPAPGVPTSTEKIFFFFFLSFVILEFLLGQNGNLFALTY